MKSKAAIFLEEAEVDPKDYVPKAMKWWSELAPKQQKEWLKKLPPEKVTQVYQDLFGSPTAGKAANEDMSKTKKVLMAAVLAAFLASTTNYYKYATPGKTRTYNASTLKFPTAPEAAVDGVQTGSMEFQVNGLITVS